MSLFVVDVESDGPVPGLYSMVSFGVVRVDEHFQCAFHGKTRPISEKWNPEALAISTITRDEHLRYPDPAKTMAEFAEWLYAASTGRPIFVADNPGYDFAFMSYYLHAYTGKNPFGHSSHRIGDFYCGLRKDWFVGAKWHKLRKTKHTHNPVDDARGNAEALIAMAAEFGVGLPK